MDDEDARRLLDIIGDVQALNDYLHGSYNKSINEDGVTNTAFGSANSFFISNSGEADSAQKDGGVGRADGAGLQLPSGLRFIEEEELNEAPPSGAEPGEEQPFDILQKSLQEADITEQTLAQEALLEAPFAPQLVSGGFGDVVGVGPSPLPFPGTQQQQGVAIQQASQQASQQPLHNGTAGHIQVLGAFGGASSMMTINSLERPQIVLRPGGGGGGGGGGQGAVFAPPATGQVGVPFKPCGPSMPLQNIIIQRGPSPQALIRPIQPKPLQVGGQTVYNISTLGFQTPPTATPPQPGGTSQSPQQIKVVNHSGNIVIQSPLGQGQGQQHPTGQFLLPAPLSLSPASSTHSPQALNGQVLHTSDRPSASTAYSILTNHSAAVQLVAGQNFSGQLIVNQGAVPGGSGVAGQVTQVSLATGAGAKAWAPGNAASGAAMQSRFALLSSAGPPAAESGAPGPQGQQQLSVNLGQGVLVPLMQDQAPATPATPETYAFSGSQESSSAAPQFINLSGNQVTPLSQVDSTSTTNTQLSSQKRPAPQQLTKGLLVLQQLRQHQASVLAADRLPFSSLEDAVHQLLPYHVYQGALPTSDEFKNVDEEFEVTATHVLKRTQSMLNKYRRLLLVDAERTNPSSEMVMIDRTFNQEERSNLTRDKRLALVDPEGFQEDFCCQVRPGCLSSAGPEKCPTGVTELQWPSLSLPKTGHHHSDLKDSGSGQADETGRGSVDPAFRTEPKPGWEGPEVSLSEHLETAIKSFLDLKKTQGGGYISPASASVQLHAPLPPQGRGPDKPLPSEHSQAAAHTDSVLEAAVNSILEC